MSLHGQLRERIGTADMETANSVLKCHYTENFEAALQNEEALRSTSFRRFHTVT